MTKATIVLDTETAIALMPHHALGKASLVVKRYIQLTKPGIVLGNLVSVAGGFFLAARGHIDVITFIATIMGVSLVVASGCVFNNYIDRDIDAKMRRTQNRVLVHGLVSPVGALMFASILGIMGLTLLDQAVNPLSALLGSLGFLVYVGVYSLYMKRHSVFGTLIGSFSGAMPPVIGYCAVSNHFDLGAAILLLTFCLWQMPHSYAIAILYLDDYTAAGIPVLPVQRGVPLAKKRIISYIPAFTLTALLLTAAGYTGYAYLTVTTAIGLYWLYTALTGYRTADTRVWARKMFVFSIISIMALSVMMAVDF